MLNITPNLDYFWGQNSKELDFKKAVLVSTQAVARWCEYFSAHPIDDRSVKREGKLPADKKEKDAFIEELVTWLTSGICPDLFTLFMGDKSILDEFSPKRYQGMKFDHHHHDDTCCWSLQLTVEEFEELKNELKKNDLPEDLFVKIEGRSE